MKKRIIIIIIAVAVVAVAAAVLIAFALGGNANVEPDKVTIDGTWKVAVYVNSDAVTIIDNEFMVFDSETAADYRDSINEPYVKSNYTLNGSELNLTDISRTYTVERVTENYMRFYEGQSTYMELIRYKDLNTDSISVDSSLVEGKWNIVYRNTANVYVGDYLLFENGNVGQYKAGNSDAVASSTYEITNNHLIVEGWGKDMVIYPLSNNVFLMVELATDNGFIWEIHKEQTE